MAAETVVTRHWTTNVAFPTGVFNGLNTCEAKVPQEDA